VRGDARAPLLVDVDATVVTAHSEKEGAARRSNAGSAIIRPQIVFCGFGV
jgi:hypothetical protein